MKDEIICNQEKEKEKEKLEWGVCSFLWGLVGQREGERDICGTAIVY